MPTAAAYANRAMAALRAGDAPGAEVDATAALALDGAYLKAWQRRAAARAKLGRRLDAIDDLEAALRCAVQPAHTQWRVVQPQVSLCDTERWDGDGDRAVCAA